MAAKTTRSKSTKPATNNHDHDHDEHDVEFKLSARASKAIDAALKGLSAAQQEKVLVAIDRVGEEAGEKVGRWVEENVVANANELLCLLAAGFAGDDRWSELAAVRLFLDHLDVPIDHAKVEKAISRAHGAKAGARYRKEIKK